MALSEEARKRLTISLTDKDVGAEVANAIDSLHAVSAASHVAPIGVTSNLVGVDGTGSNAAPLAGTESRLDTIEAKVDAIISALIAAGLMS